MNVNDKERLDRIVKKLEGGKVTCFCEWDNDIRWMIRKLTYQTWSTDDAGVDRTLEEEYSLLLARTNVLSQKIDQARTALQ